MEKYDFSGVVTKANLKCSDGRVIMPDAFKHNDGQVVPLVWNHQHNDPSEILGHVLLKNRGSDVYGYGTFNDTENAQNAKLCVEHGDIVSLSICANQLKQNGANVIHGNIREVSLVLAGANPGASIDNIIIHGEESTEEAVIFADQNISIEELDIENTVSHADTSDNKTDDKEKTNMEENNGGEKTVKEVFDSLTEEQKTVVYAMIGQALEDAGAGTNDVEHSNMNNGGDTMKHNVFDNETSNENTLSHSELSAVLTDAKRGAGGSLREALFAKCDGDETLAHSVTDDSGNTISYGVADIDYLFPDARATSNVPDLITRDMGWVSKVMGGAKHLPFSRVKSIHANITMDEARAKGYIKANEKANTVFALLKRTTNPTTIYHKTKLDRDDIVDITDFDIVAWIKRNERVLLDEEIARAALVGDGRQVGTDDKISEDCIRPIWSDNSTYVVRKSITPAAGNTDEDNAKAFIREAIKARKDYKGSGNPTLFTTEDVLTDCLLIEDGNGRVIYETEDKLRTTLRVKEIVTVPVMEGLTRTGTGADAGYDFGLMGIFVNMTDYGFGADKGGAVNLFDDFDIDFNQQKYLIETRCSGALMKPYSAIVIEKKTVTSGS